MLNFASCGRRFERVWLKKDLHGNPNIEKQNKEVKKLLWLHLGRYISAFWPIGCSLPPSYTYRLSHFIWEQSWNWAYLQLHLYSAKRSASQLKKHKYLKESSSTSSISKCFKSWGIIERGWFISFQYSLWHGVSRPAESHAAQLNNGLVSQARTL